MLGSVRGSCLDRRYLIDLKRLHDAAKDGYGAD